MVMSERERGKIAKHVNRWNGDEIGFVMVRIAKESSQVCAQIYITQND